MPLLAVSAGVCLAQGYSSVSLARAPHGIPPKNASMVPAGQPNSTNNGILYWGGPVNSRTLCVSS
jgi:hypothetical protein